MNPIWITHPVSAALMITLPLVLGATLIRRFKLNWSLWWIGAAAFVSSQLAHIPFNAAVGVMFERGWLPKIPDGYSLIFSAVFLGASAGMWEGWFRYIAYRWWAKPARTWRSGIVLGAGHGGIEAILLGGLSLFTFTRIAFYTGKDLQLYFPANQVLIAEQQIASYGNLDWQLPLLAPLERIFSIIMHIAVSLLVLQAFTRGSKAWVWLGIGWHAMADGIVVYYATIWQGYAWQAYALEGLIGMAALVSLGIIFLLRQPEQFASVSMPPLPEQISPVQLTPIEETTENLDNSRFSNHP